MNIQQRKTTVLIACIVTIVPLILLLIECVLDGYNNNTLNKLLSDKE